jgi:hypothetical protein
LKKIFRLFYDGQFGKKYFDYFGFKIVDYGVNCGLPRSGARCRALAQTIGNARGLDINSPRSTKIILKTYDFVDISNATIPTTLGGSTTTSPPIVIVILRQQLDYDIVDYGRAAPIKAKFSSSKSRFLFTFSPQPILGGSAMKNHLAYH